MPQLPHGRSTRSGRRRFWFDPRFAIGLGLVLVSVTGVVFLVSSTDSSVVVLAARGTISPGDRIEVGDLVETRVQLRAAESKYLHPAAMPADGIVVTRSVGTGELIPVSAISSAAGIDATAIILALSSPLPGSVETGSRLDVWASREDTAGVFGAPTVLVSAADVVRLVEEDGLMSSSAGNSVEVLIPRSAIARVLEAVANGASLSAVPRDLPVGR
ncbi:MAG: rane protein [Glaciihabitans sp.]|nr:rane protein [Glaciihabitans sp.]